MYNYSGSESVLKLNIFSYINFCRVDFPTYNQLMKILTNILLEEEEYKQAEEEEEEEEEKDQQEKKETDQMASSLSISLRPSNNIADLFQLLPKFPFDSKSYFTTFPSSTSTTKDNNIMVPDTIGLSRVYFLLSVLEKVIKKLPEQLIRDELLPLLFSYPLHLVSLIHSISFLLFYIYYYILNRIISVVSRILIWQSIDIATAYSKLDSLLNILASWRQFPFMLKYL